MKITKKYLREIIKEEVRKLTEEKELKQLNGSLEVFALRDVLRQRKDLGTFLGSRSTLQKGPDGMTYIVVKFGFHPN